MFSKTQKPIGLASFATAFGLILALGVLLVPAEAAGREGAAERRDGGLRHRGLVREREAP